MRFDPTAHAAEWLFEPPCSTWLREPPPRSRPRLAIADREQGPDVCVETVCQRFCSTQEPYQLPQHSIGGTSPSRDAVPRLPAAPRGAAASFECCPGNSSARASKPLQRRGLGESIDGSGPRQARAAHQSQATRHVHRQILHRGRLQTADNGEPLSIADPPRLNGISTRATRGGTSCSRP
jgi:hypothetical protein